MKYLKYFESLNGTVNSLEKFLSSKNRNAWIYSKDMKIYVRKSRYLINKEFIDFIDLASIEVYEKNKGHFTSFIKSLLIEYPYKNIYVQNIMNPALEHILNKLGFLVDEKMSMEGCVCMYKLKENL